MTEENKEEQSDQKTNDKEMNFRALEARYKKELEAERAEREKVAREANEMRERLMSMQSSDDSDDDDEPYIDSKKLKKELGKTTQQLKKESQAEIKNAINQALSEERQTQWVKNNPDFYEVMQHAEKLAEIDPELADTILKMPEGFERQKLVYRNIKTLNLHKPKEEKDSIQNKIDQNKRSPYYQPSDASSAPYGMTGDFSQAGQKKAYDHLQALKKRIGAF